MESAGIRAEHFASGIGTAAIGTKSVFAVFFLAIVFILALLPATPVINIMEARNFQSAEEIVERGEWLFPTLNGSPRILKPPLPTWACAFMGKITGDTRNVFYLRLPNALAAVLLLSFVFLLVRDIYGRRAAFFSTLILATSAQFFREVQVARWDMFACSLGFGSLWAISRALQGSYLYAVPAIALSAASYLSKGPVAIGFILAPFFCALMISQRLRPCDCPDSDKLRRILPAAFGPWLMLFGMVVAGLALGHLWWWAVQLHLPDAWQEISRDILSKVAGKYKRPYFYFVLLPGLLVPWTVFLLLSFVILGREMAKRDRPRNQLLFPMLWCVIGVLMLSLPSEKKSRYFLQLLPSFAVLLGVSCDFCASTFLRWKDFRWSRYCLALHRFALAVFLISAPVPIYILTKYGAPLSIWIVSLLLVALGLWVLAGPLDITRLVVETGVGIFIAGVAISLCLPTTSLIQDRYEMAHPVKELTRDMPLYLLGNDHHTLLWAMGKCYRKIGDMPSLLSEKWPAMVLVESPWNAGMEDFLRAHALAGTEIYRFAVWDQKEDWYSLDRWREREVETIWHLYRIGK